jgi:hypothetical protein
MILFQIVIQNNDVIFLKNEYHFIDFVQYHVIDGFL